MNTSPTALMIFLAAIFTNNILLSNFLGMCSFLACSKELETAFGLGLAVTFVTASTSTINYLLYHFILIPLGLEHLSFIIFITVIAAFVQFVEMYIEKYSPKLYHILGIFLPLITVNCAILGVSLFIVLREYTFIQSFSFGLGAGLGWMLAILLLAGMRAKMRYSNVPKHFQNVAITMIVTGIMAMAFLGFTGMLAIE